MGDTTFCATCDDNVGVVYLTKAELYEFATGAGSDKGEHITSMLIKHCFHLVSCVLSEARQEILMETDDLAFKLRLRFDICCMAAEERSMSQNEEDLSVLYHRGMCHVST